MKTLLAMLALTLLGGSSCPAQDPSEPLTSEDGGVLDADSSMMAEASNACTALVQRTCAPLDGGGMICPDRPACQQALREQEASAQDPGVIDRCRQALEESSLYPRCEP